MNHIQLNLTQSLKLLWSFLWRTWVLMMPLMMFVGICMFVFFFNAIPKDGSAPKPPDLKYIPLFFLIWIVMVVGGFLLQALALKWALAAKWSDFKIITVSTKDNTQNEP